MMNGSIYAVSLAGIYILVTAGAVFCARIAWVSMLLGGGTFSYYAREER